MVSIIEHVFDYRDHPGLMISSLSISGISAGYPQKSHCCPQKNIVFPLAFHKCAALACRYFSRCGTPVVNKNRSTNPSKRKISTKRVGGKPRRRSSHSNASHGNANRAVQSPSPWGQSDPTEGIRSPELFFAIVAPVGAESRTVAEKLAELLKGDGYEVYQAHIIEALYKISYDHLDKQLAKQIREDLSLAKLKELAGPSLESSAGDKFEYYRRHMDAGNIFCRITERKDALALMTARWLHDLPMTSGSPRPQPSSAYILSSFKRRDELRTLRNIYGPSLYVIGAYASQNARKQILATSIARSKRLGRADDHFDEAEALIKRDRAELSDPYGQRLSETFAEADVFIDASSDSSIERDLERFLDLVFDDFFATPSHEEYGQFIAAATALRSADLSRQVGAAVLTEDGSVVATGTNEVPRPGGGQVLIAPEAGKDPRDFKLKLDSSSEIKQRALEQLWDAFYSLSLIDESTYKGKRDQVTKHWKELLGQSEFRVVGEFGRSIHAEMACLVDAARRGIPVAGCVLHITTFPCHVCARHVAAAGIRKVVFIEPYPKSLATDLHMDALAVEGPDLYPKNLPIVPFVGIAPRRYQEVFAMNRSRLDGLQPKKWKRSRDGRPAVGSIPSAYMFNEERATNLILSRLADKGVEIL
jgi:cytidine deaminase